MILESLFLGLLAWSLPLFYCLCPRIRHISPVLLGSGAACAHGMDRAARTLQGLAAEQPLAVDFPVAAVSLATGALILFLLLGTVLSLHRQAGRDLLGQLQGKG